MAAALSVGVAGALAGFMAAGDQGASASQPAVNNDANSGGSSSGYANPYRGNDDGTQYAPRPQTRTGGS